MWSIHRYAGLDPDWLAILSIGVFIYMAYAINHYTDHLEDFANDAGKALYFGRRSIHFNLAVGLASATVVLLAATGKLAFTHLVIIATSVMYSYRMLPWYRPGEGLVFIKLKQLFLVKNISVSLLWVMSLFYLPSREGQTPLAEGCFLPALYMLAMIFTNTVFGDVRDIKGDTLAGHKTLPVLVGERRTLYFLCALCLGASLAAAIMLSMGTIGLPVGAFLMLTSGFPLVYLGMYMAGYRYRALLEIINESDMIWFAGGLAILSVMV